jgi:hypothetical protein
MPPAENAPLDPDREPVPEPVPEPVGDTSSEAGADAPEPGPDVSPPAPDGRARIRPGLLIVGALVLAGVLSFFAIRVLTSGRGIDLAVGECFDPPAATTEAVSDVQRRPCTESHRAEVFLVADHPAGGGAALPTDEELQAYLEQVCGPALIGYAGGVDRVPESIDIGLFYPSDQGWRGGGRRMTCYAATIDGSQLTRSLRPGG